MAKKQNKMLKVTLIKSPIGYNKGQKEIVKSLGLRKMNRTVILGDAPHIRGMVDKVSHLVTVEEVIE